MTVLPTTTNDDKPAFGCIVYVHRTTTHRVRGRVANLEGIETEGANEREVLTHVVKEVRALIADHMDRDEAIPWIDPPVDMMAGESRRFMPLHL